MSRHHLFQHQLARFLRRWHARLGVTAALFFIVLILTGVALNHTERLGLARTAIRSEALTRWYGLPPPRIVAVYAAAEFIATPTDWLYKGQRLADGGGAVVGAVSTPDMLVVATAQSLSLYSHTGERIDTLRSAALPHLPITALGRTTSTTVLKTPIGLFASADGLIWQSISDSGVIWAHSQKPDVQTIERVRKQLTPSLPLERVMLDIHSGRLLGRYGPFLVDGAAFILLLLSLSGIWIQWRSWRQKHRHPHKA